MNKKDQQFGRLAAALLAIAIAACGSTQGTSTALAGVTSDGYATDEGQLTNGANAAHLTEFGASESKTQVIDPAMQQAIALDQKNETERLAQQGAKLALPAVSSPTGSAIEGPSLAP